MATSRELFSNTKTAAWYGVNRNRIITEKDLSHKDKMARGSYPKEDIFDKPALLDRMIRNKEFAKEIMNTFFEDVNRRVDVIKEALGNGDALTVSAQAHTIRNSSSSVGAIDLEEVAYQMEVAGESGDLVKVGGLVCKINEFFEILKTYWPHQDDKKLVSFYDNFDSRR